jgi:hypothetical protein
LVNKKMLEHVPTDKTREQVLSASGLGLPQVQIAALLGISDVTLRKHYEKELAVGKATASAQIAKSLYNKAVSGDTTAAIWWTKAQMGWGETNTTKVGNIDGTPLEGIQITFVKPGDGSTT